LPESEQPDINANRCGRDNSALFISLTRTPIWSANARNESGRNSQARSTVRE
jgi:hypothetical protein